MVSALSNLYKDKLFIKKLIPKAWKGEQINDFFRWKMDFQHNPCQKALPNAL